MLNVIKDYSFLMIFSIMEGSKIASFMEKEAKELLHRSIASREFIRMVRKNMEL